MYKVIVKEFSQQNYASRSVYMGEKEVGKFEASLIINYHSTGIFDIDLMRFYLEFNDEKICLGMTDYDLEEEKDLRGLYRLFETNHRSPYFAVGQRIMRYTHNPSQGIAYGYIIERIG